MKAKSNAVRRPRFIIVSPEWGTLVIAPGMGICAGWSEMFPHARPIEFATRKAANAVAMQHWDPSMNLLIGHAPMKVSRAD